MLDHGVTSRLLNGWIKGDLANADAKWSSHQFRLMSSFLSSIASPIEIRANRPIRDFTCIAKWKGIEYRHFALYVGIVVLKGNLKDYLYNHFILYFCAVTMFSSSVHLQRKKKRLKKLSALDVEPLSRLIKQKYNLYERIELEKLQIDCTRDQDRWILTTDLQILQVSFLVHTIGGHIFIYGFPLDAQHDYFDLTIRSSNLYIYSVDSLQTKSAVLCPIDYIKCKMFKMERDGKYVFGDDQNTREYVFLPILSTLT